MIKTIAIFSGYALPHLGGIERYTDNLARKLVLRGYKVIIVSSNYNFSANNYKEKDGIEYYKIPVKRLFVGRYPIPEKNKIYKNIIEELSNKNINAIIVNTRFHLTTLVGSKFGKKRDIPVFLIEHGSQHLTVNNKILDFLGAIYEHLLTNIVKKNVDYYYGVSNEACNWQKHFKITSNGIWYNSINNFYDSKLVNKNDKIINILYAGRILKQKGVLELIEAFKKLSKKYDNIFLTIAGDGDLLDELKKKNYNNTKIFFLGKLDFNSLIKEYEKANVFVYAPNWPEGLPTAILEAGLMKCAVISSPQGGNKEIVIDNETGLMINNEKELENALEKLITDLKLRNALAKKLNEKVLYEFTWDKTSERIIKDINSKLKK